MNDDTVQLLKECNLGCKMAVESIHQVTEYATDEKMLHLLEEYKQKHKELEVESEKLLLAAGLEGKEPGMMASSFSWLSTEMKMMMEDDNRQIGKIMMDGCNMGIKSISEYRNQYANADREARNIARGILKVEEEFVQKLEKFL
ncbi:MAG: hypothetical protein PHQ72_09305 [Hespellia sp.]|nr:hypothetical protein [Hespellia sp.]